MAAALPAADVTRLRGAPAPLLLPMESRIRELDARILLACAAAARGRAAYLGATSDINAALHRLPPGIYVAKALTRGSLRAFRRARGFGHRVAAWDEEAVVHYAAPLFYPRRIDAETIQQVERFYAWGEDNLALWRDYPGFPMDRVTLTGNSRADLLKPRLRALYAEAAEAIRRRHGDFVLINTNFGSINCDLPTLNLKYPDPADPRRMLYGVTARGLPQADVDRLYDHRIGLFRSFEALASEAARRLPDVRFVLRPHFAESEAHWQRLLADLPNVTVARDGNVIAWLMAARMMIHNGCTTAVEAYALGTPAIAYEAVRDPRYDLTLPNSLSRSCANVDETVSAIRQMLAKPEAPGSAARDRLLEPFIHSAGDRLASELILDDLDRLPEATLGFGARARRLWAMARAGGKPAASEGGSEKMAHKRMKFATLDATEVAMTARRICAILGIPAVRTDARGGGVVSIAPADS